MYVLYIYVCKLYVCKFPPHLTKLYLVACMYKYPKQQTQIPLLSFIWLYVHIYKFSAQLTKLYLAVCTYI